MTAAESQHLRPVWARPICVPNLTSNAVKVFHFLCLCNKSLVLPRKILSILIGTLSGRTDLHNRFGLKIDRDRTLVKAGPKRWEGNRRGVVRIDVVLESSVICAVRARECHASWSDSAASSHVEVDAVRIKLGTNLTESLKICRHSESKVQGNNLLPHDVGAWLNIGRNVDRERHVRLVHQPHGRPASLVIPDVFRYFEEWKLVHAGPGDVATIRGHPCRERTFVAVEPTRPMECDVASSPDLSNCTRKGAVRGVTRQVVAGGGSDGASVGHAILKSLDGTLQRRIKVDIIARVASSCKQDAIL